MVERMLTGSHLCMERATQMPQPIFQDKIKVRFIFQHWVEIDRNFLIEVHFPLHGA